MINNRWLSFSVPLISTLAAMSSVGFYLTFISLYFSNQGYSNAIIGVIQASYFLGLFLGAYFLENLLRRVGHIQVLALAGSLITSTILTQSFSDNILLWASTRCLAGFAMAAFYVVIECWMLDQTEQKERGFCLSLYMVALNLGYAVGLQIIPAIPMDSTVAFTVAALLTALSIAPVALSTQKLTLPEAAAGLQIAKLARISPFGTVSCLASGITISSLYSFLALVGEHYEGHGAQLVATLVIGGLLAQWPLGRLSDLFDRRGVLLGIYILLFLCSFLLFIGKDLSTFLSYAGIFIIGCGVFTLYPISLTQVIDHLSSHQFAAGTASLLLMYGAGSVLGPILTSAAMYYTGMSGLFLFLSLIAIATGAVGIGSFRKKAVPENEKEPFFPLPRTTAVVYELDPRGEYESIPPEDRSSDL